MINKHRPHWNRLLSFMIMVSLINTILTLQQKGLGHCRFVRMLLNGSNSLAIIGINWVEVKNEVNFSTKRKVAVKWIARILNVQMKNIKMGMIRQILKQFLRYQSQKNETVPESFCDQQKYNTSKIDNIKNRNPSWWRAESFQNFTNRTGPQLTQQSNLNEECF